MKNSFEMSVASKRTSTALILLLLFEKGKKHPEERRKTFDQWKSFFDLAEDARCRTVVERRFQTGDGLRRCANEANVDVFPAECDVERMCDETTIGPTRDFELFERHFLIVLT